MQWTEFIALPDDDRRELIGGQLMELEVPTELHEHIVMMLGYFLIDWRRANKGGVVLGSGFKVRIDDEHGFMPDAQYFKRGREVPEQGLDEGGPDLAVEVISPSSAKYDRVDKLEGYASIGTSEYWLIHPDERTLHRYLLRDGELILEETLEGDDVFRPSTFAGLEIPLSELWTLPN